MRSIDLRNVPRRPVDGGYPAVASAASDGGNRWAAAYHEAGHAVFAYEVGWWVNHEGIDLERQFTGLGCREIDYTPWRRVWVHLAGPLAECRYLGLIPLFDDGHLTAVLSTVRRGRPCSGDEGDVLRALVDQFPDESDRSLLEKYRAYAEQIWHAMVDGPEVWRRIESVSAALFGKGRLTADDVELLLPTDE